MITRLTSPRKFRSYLTYDLEWEPGTMRLRLIGVYDRERGYRSYVSVDAFLDRELTSKNRGRWFYAHFGGAADFQFLWARFLEMRGYTVRGSFSGSSAIIVHVTRGKNCWHFVDSFWLLHDTLRSIGAGIGISKGNEDECVQFFTDAPLDVLRDYNEIDCIILYQAIEQFEEVLFELGGQLKMTVASCGMELFRRRFLSSDVETSYAVNNKIRQAYIASRVEVFERELDRDNALYWDVNSSFPYAMTYPLPGALMGTYRKRLPDVGITFAEVTVTVPECYLPPLPTKIDGRVFFPHGRWRGWYSGCDLELLMEMGGKINKVHQAMAFEPMTDLRDYAQTVFDMRKKATGFRKIVYKYVLNCLYGKFAEDEWKSGLVLDPPEIKSGYEMVMPGVFLTESRVPIPHMHVPISAYITSIARRTLYRLMMSQEKVYYCDTDGFAGYQTYNGTVNALVERILAIDEDSSIAPENKDGLRSELVQKLVLYMADNYAGVGNELGNVKLEKVLRRGAYLAAKVYLQDGVNEKGKELLHNPEKPCARCGKLHKEEVPGIKAKGFSKMSIAKFERLRDGEEIEYVRMARIKEQIRQGKSKPREDVIRKRLRLDTVSKRYFYPDGSSRPWHIKELEGDS